MLRRFVTILTAILFTICGKSSLFAWSENLESIRKATDSVQSISASFIQEKHLAILKRPLISKGLLLFEKPNALRWEYQAPIASIVMSYQGSTARYLKQDSEFIKDVGTHVQLIQVVLGEISQWLAGRFEDSDHFSAALKEYGIVTLKPVNNEMTRIISHVQIEFAKQPGLIKSVTIYENSNSFTKLIFQNARLNEPINPSLFQNP